MFQLPCPPRLGLGLAAEFGTGQHGGRGGRGGDCDRSTDHRWNMRGLVNAPMGAGQSPPQGPQPPPPPLFFRNKGTPTPPCLPWRWWGHSLRRERAVLLSTGRPSSADAVSPGAPVPCAPPPPPCALSFPGRVQAEGTDDGGLALDTDLGTESHHKHCQWSGMSLRAEGGRGVA